MQLAKVETSVGDDAAAETLTAFILAQRLAACIQCEPITSQYRWEGSVVREGEVRITCKTTLAAREDLVQLLLAHHPYEVPEILVQVVDTSEAYGAWVQAEVMHG